MIMFRINTIFRALSYRYYYCTNKTVPLLRPVLVVSYRLRKALTGFLLTSRINSVHRNYILKGLLITAVSVKAMASSNDEAVIKEADQLMDKDKMRAAFDVLKAHADSQNVNIQWRIARICYRLGKYQSKDQSEAKELAEMGIVHADKAIALDGTSYAAYRWKGVLLNWSLDFEGYKRKIEKSFEIRENFDKASELNPTDATTKHLIGRWCFEVANVPWYMRKAAQYIFATPPSSTYEEALKYFEDAEKLSPGFYCPNQLYIGKCYSLIGKKAEAKEWLLKAAAQRNNFDNLLGDAKEAVTEAEKLLSGM